MLQRPFTASHIVSSGKLAKWRSSIPDRLQHYIKTAHNVVRRVIFIQKWLFASHDPEQEQWDTRQSGPHLCRERASNELETQILGVESLIKRIYIQPGWWVSFPRI
ncbi:unnamed protein product [Ixodes pacificus]